MAPSDLDAKSEERSQIKEVAEFVGFKKDDLKDTPNNEIIEQVVRKDDPDTPTDASPDYLRGVFANIARNASREDANTLR